MTVRFQDMPKVELHTHIDCSLSQATIAQLGLDLTPEEYRQNFVAPERCRDLTEFLACIDPAWKILQTRKALEIAVDGMVAAQAADNIVYAEMRFAPHLHQDQGLALEEIVETVLHAMHASSSKYGVDCALILCTLRHFNEDQGKDVADLVCKYANQGVVAIDLAGDEANFPIEPHISAFRLVREAGLNCIAHAGESAGAQSVMETIEKLNPQRIGHGVRSIEDPALVERLVRAGTHLEVCPTCNIQTGIFPTIFQHSLAPLRAAGVDLGLNTDARATTNVSLSDEYKKVSEAFGWSNHEMLRLTQSALYASFATDVVRAQVEAKLDSFTA